MAENTNSEEASVLSLIERRKEIVRYLESDGIVDVKRLAKKFNVSTVTIRTDLNEMNAKGLLVRSRGGAVVSTRLTRELSVRQKYKENLGVKHQLGIATEGRLGAEVRSLAIDSGTTAEEVARSLLTRTNLTVMTNGLNIATALANADGIEVMMTGGTLRSKSMSFYGGEAEKTLRLMHFDCMILGADGVDTRAGVSTFFGPEASLNRAMCEASSKIIVVADSSKFGRRGPHIICKIEEIDTLVTDSNAPSDVVLELKSNGIDVHLVDV